MGELNRRDFVAMSVAGLSALGVTDAALAAVQCVSGPLPGFLPNRLTVDCASGRNFQLFRQYTPYLGLTGVVSMTSVRGAMGTYAAGNLFLFPWLKPKGLALRGRAWAAVAPTSSVAFTSASPVPGSGLPQDEYFCRIVLQAPWQYFIGFTADAPFSPEVARLNWYSNIEKLGDGQGIGIDWTSSNLNASWFGGSSYIPDQDACNGNAWRKLIAEGLNQASVGAC